MVMGNRVKDVENSQPAGSWGRFARRMQSNPQFQEESHRDSVWVFVAISVLYFTLIGVVLLILLLAPKFKTVHIPPDNSPGLVTAETAVSREVPLFDESEDYSVTENSFVGPPSDPLYEDIGIDPRSPIFRGDMHEWKEPERRERSGANSKYLQD